MSIFNSHEFADHEQVIFCYDEPSGLKAIIAIHNTSRGPALGGCRFWAYASEADALIDVLRLSKGMTYKAALANINHGGGKAVVIGDAASDKTPEKLRALGRFIERLNGLYVTGEDVGTNSHDMNIIYETTKHVRGRDIEKGGGGDPSPFTALGVLTGIKACVKYQQGRDDIAGIRVAIQGLGHVGMSLAKLLSNEGASLVVADINQAQLDWAATSLGAQVVSTLEIYSADVDVFAPCALGGVLNDETIPILKAKIVAGSANNQLREHFHSDMLEKRRILYAPDYVINAGGLINVAFEGPGYDINVVTEHVGRIHDTLLEIFETAQKENITTSEASDRIAYARFN